MMFGSVMQVPQGGEIDSALLNALRKRFGGAGMSDPTSSVTIAPPVPSQAPMPAGSPGGNEGLPQAPTGMFGGQRRASIFASGRQSSPNIGVAPPPSSPMPGVGGIFGSPLAADLAKAKMRNTPAGLRATAGNELDTSNLPAVSMATPGDAGPITDPSAAAGQLGQVVNAGMRVKKPGFFDKDGAWRPTLLALSDAAMMLSAGGGNPAAMAFMQNKWQSQRDQQLSTLEAQRQYAQWQRNAALHQWDEKWKASQPQYFSGNEDRLAFDPVTGTTKTLYDAPTDAQAYAESLGLGKGTPEYNKAMQDFVLKGSGPTAFGYDTDLANLRFKNSTVLKGTPTYRDLNAPPPRSGSGGGRRPSPSSLPRPPHTLAGVVAPMMDKLAKGQPLSPSEQTVYDAYMNRGRGTGRGRGGAGSGGAGGSNIVVNPTTGERKQWTGSAWVTVK